jgi:hypothetical protein
MYDSNCYLGTLFYWLFGGIGDGRFGGIKLCLTYIRNILIHKATCSCIVELLENLKHIHGFFQKRGYFADFFYIITQ